MRYHPIFLASTLFVLFAGPSLADPPSENAWSELENDPSRQSLFNDRVIPAKLREEAAQPSDSISTLAFPKEFNFPDDAQYDVILKKERENSYFGIDISHHTGPNIQFTNLRLQRVLFVYTKATQGTGFKDKLFGRFWSQLGALPKNEKVYRGAYHFLSSDSPGLSQAESFLAYTGLHGGFKPDDMPPCLDLEWDKTATNPEDRWAGHAPEEIIQNALDWLKEVNRKTGRKPMIYTALSWWKERGIPVEKIALFKDYTVWIADYSKSHKAIEKPSVIGGRTQDIWQFADDAKLATGYSGVVDANVFYGKFDEFKTAFGIVE